MVRGAGVDPSFAAVGVTDGSYWFASLQNLVDVTGFESMTTLTKAAQMFSGCSALESIYATSFTSSITTASGMFYGCKCLVGGTDGYVPYSSSGGRAVKIGSGGVLTDPAADNREWFKVYFYADGSVVLTKDGAIDPAKALKASGRMCANAKYNVAGVIPGYASRAQITSIAIAADMAQFSYVNTNYWFYTLSAVTSITGLGNLTGVREMQYMFTTCSGLTELDFRGFDPSHLTNLDMAFGSCSNLTTIYADSTWALPKSGVSGSSVFYNCGKLVGGNGTAWSSGAAGYTYFRIDKSGQAGYLTAV